MDKHKNKFCFNNVKYKSNWRLHNVFFFKLSSKQSVHLDIKTNGKFLTSSQLVIICNKNDFYLSCLFVCLRPYKMN